MITMHFKVIVAFVVEYLGGHFLEHIAEEG